MKSDLKNGRVFTLPNLVTVARFLLLIPIFVFLARGERTAVFFLGFLGVCMDLLDGFLARRLNQFSELGRIMDPVFDKIAVLSVVLYMVFSPMYRFPLWFFLFLLVRELAVLVFGLLLLKKTSKVSESNRAGKWSAFITGTVVLLYILGWQPYGIIMLWIAFVLTLYSSFTYLNAYLRTSKKP